VPPGPDGGARVRLGPRGRELAARARRHGGGR
jgi:hypothetical protein